MADEVIGIEQLEDYDSMLKSHLNSTIVTSLSSSNTDSQIPSAKCVYESIDDLTEIFIAEYGVTTYAEISAAYNAGKLCFCDTGSQIINLLTINETTCRFLQLVSSGTLTKITCLSDNTWNQNSVNITLFNLTPDRVLVTDSNGYSNTSEITTTELGYLDGVTDNIQTQINDTRLGMMGYCDTASTESVKIVTMPGFNINRVFNQLVITFENDNSYEDGPIYLNVNNTGNIKLYINGTVTSNTNYNLFSGTYFVRLRYFTEASPLNRYEIYTNAYIPFNTVLSDKASTDNSGYELRCGVYPVCTTSSSVANKIAICRDYVLRQHNRFILEFVNSNSYTGQLTLNINNTGAKTIYIDGDITDGSNYTLPAGLYMVYYDGTRYYIETDGAIKLDDGYALGSNRIVSSISESSTHGQIPSAKCVYDMIGNIEALMEELL